MLVLGIMSIILALFAIVEALEVPLLTQPQPWMETAGVPAALVGVGLLVVDVLLPVPSSLVMVAHGALFGVLLGTALSMVGSLGAAAVGFYVGRRGGALVGRLLGPEERAEADALLAKWGTLAIVVSRPMPIVAETVAIMAGASSIRWAPAIAAAAVGALPPALLFALAGALAVGFASFTVVFLLVVVLGGAFWWVARWWREDHPAQPVRD